MKFLKGMVIGGMIAAGTAMICADRDVCQQEKNDENGETICKKNGNDVVKVRSRKNIPTSNFIFHKCY